MPPEPVRFIIDGAAMAELLQGPEGPVVGHLIRVADAIIAGARAELEPHKKTGRLAASLVKRPIMTPAGPGMLVIAGAGLKDPNYAYWVHEGNAPEGSRIYPKRARVLAWVTSGERPTTAEGWRAARAAGTAVIRPSVRASRPVKYLTKYLYLAGTVR